MKTLQDLKALKTPLERATSLLSMLYPNDGSKESSAFDRLERIQKTGIPVYVVPIQDMGTSYIVESVWMDGCEYNRDADTGHRRYGNDYLCRLLQPSRAYPTWRSPEHSEVNSVRAIHFRSSPVFYVFDLTREGFLKEYIRGLIKDPKTFVPENTNVEQLVPVVAMNKSK